MIFAFLWCAMYYVTLKRHFRLWKHVMWRTDRLDNCTMLELRLCNEYRRWRPPPWWRSLSSCSQRCACETMQYNLIPVLEKMPSCCLAGTVVIPHRDLSYLNALEMTVIIANIQRYMRVYTTYFLWSPDGIGQTITFSCCSLFFLLFLLFLA